MRNKPRHTYLNYFVMLTNQSVLLSARSPNWMLFTPQLFCSVHETWSEEGDKHIKEALDQSVNFHFNPTYDYELWVVTGRIRTNCKCCISCVCIKHFMPKFYVKYLIIFYCERVDWTILKSLQRTKNFPLLSVLRIFILSLHLSVNLSPR